MEQRPEVSELALEGAASVYEFIERTSVPTAEGVRWQSGCA